MLRYETAADNEARVLAGGIKRFGTCVDSGVARKDQKFWELSRRRDLISLSIGSRDSFCFRSRIQI